MLYLRSLSIPIVLLIISRYVEGLGKAAHWAGAELRLPSEAQGVLSRGKDAAHCKQHCWQPGLRSDYMMHRLLTLWGTRFFLSFDSGCSTLWSSSHTYLFGRAEALLGRFKGILSPWQGCKDPGLHAQCRRTWLGSHDSCGPVYYFAGPLTALKHCPRPQVHR